MTKRQEKILDQAMDLMIQEGIKGLTMKKVADRMKFTEPAMYRHFKDKQDMVVALIHRIRTGYEEVVSKADKTRDPREYFHAMVCSLLDYLEQVRGVTILFLSESTFSRDDEVRKALLAFYSGMIWHVAEYLKEARERGLVRGDVDEEAGAVILVGMIQSLTIRFLLSGGELKITDKCENILNIFLRGVLI